MKVQHAESEGDGWLRIPLHNRRSNGEAVGCCLGPKRNEAKPIGTVNIELPKSFLPACLEGGRQSNLRRGSQWSQIVDSGDSARTAYASRNYSEQKLAFVKRVRKCKWTVKISRPRRRSIVLASCLCHTQ